ncbi:hypothetical protein [Arthrobacter sp.]|uniref:hypothetical protein n=1 Tax=Arthrobacter sp. TaxID=1667 RepID=UPI0026E01F55|nr:hypothetical protein [Arthrobacter sp.]MDO5753593.1 hypothetical protein [Arthrobacter sp.]
MFNSINSLLSVSAILFAVYLAGVALTLGRKDRVVCNAPFRKKGRCKDPILVGGANDGKCEAGHGNSWIGVNYGFAVVMVVIGAYLFIAQPLTVGS